MRILIYNNKGKDIGGVWLKQFVNLLIEEKIDYRVLNDENLSEQESADAIFVHGGDGTILFLTEFASRNGIPIIGINAGKLGFLTEFENDEAKTALKLLKENKLIIDERATMHISYKNKSYFALNDVFLQRIYQGTTGMLVEVAVNIDDNKVASFKGDGLVISTPTGSTAYSLSAGGPVLSPMMNAFVMTPLAAHSLNTKPIVFSARSECTVMVDGKTTTGLFIDGTFIDTLVHGDYIKINKNVNKVIFLRKKSFNFYNRLNKKLNNSLD